MSAEVTVALRQISLPIATAGVTLGFIALLASVHGEPPATPPGDEQLEQARRDYQQRNVRPPEPPAPAGASIQPRTSPDQQTTATDDPPVDTGADMDPDVYLNPRMMNPDMEPEKPFDPHNLVLTGDETYDRKTRSSAAHRLHGQQDYPGAIKMATEILNETPDNMRLHLLVIQSACALGDDGLASEHFTRLPERMRLNARKLCARHDIKLTE